MSASATIRTTIVAALSTRPCTTFALAELAGMEWDGSARRMVHKAIEQLQVDGFRIVNIHLPGSHRGGMYVMTAVMPCPCLLEFDPDFRIHPRVTLPPRRCGTPGCISYLARDHILQGAAYCSLHEKRRGRADCIALLGFDLSLEFEQFEVTT